MKLFTLSNPKLSKGIAAGWLSAVLHLAPHKLSGRNVCPMASNGCSRACLNFSGRGAMPKVQAARIRKTHLMFEDRPAFLAQAIKDLEALRRKADRESLQPCARFNGTSDVVIERKFPELFDTFPDIQFYDYTKIPGRNNLPSNYHLTFSRSESNQSQCVKELEHGRNVAVVFGPGSSLGDALDWHADYLWSDKAKQKWGSAMAFDAMSTDLRFLDPTVGVAYLQANGRGKKDSSGFVVHAGEYDA